MFTNFIEINLIEDSDGDRLFSFINSIDDFYLKGSMIAGAEIGNKNNTGIFLDEIQQYPKLLTMLKFIQQDDKYNYIAIGSLLGITLAQTTSMPMGCIRKIRMFPIDFEEFLIAHEFKLYYYDNRNKGEVVYLIDDFNNLSFLSR